MTEARFQIANPDSNSLTSHQKHGVPQRRLLQMGASEGVLAIRSYFARLILEKSGRPYQNRTRPEYAKMIK